MFRADLDSFRAVPFRYAELLVVSAFLSGIFSVSQAEASHFRSVAE